MTGQEACATETLEECSPMDESAKPPDICKVGVKTAQEYRRELPGIVNELVLSCRREDCFDHVGPEPLPSREAAIDIIHRACRLLYPGYLSAGGWMRSISTTISARKPWPSMKPWPPRSPCASGMNACGTIRIAPTVKTGANKRLSALCGRCPIWARPGQGCAGRV